MNFLKKKNTIIEINIKKKKSNLASIILDLKIQNLDLKGKFFKIITHKQK